MNIYQQRLMDHYRHPRNRGTLEKPDFLSGMFNPSCGDAVSIAVCSVDGLITAIAFEGSGCVISQAAASLLTERVLNNTHEYARGIMPDDMVALVGIDLGPTRLKCAVLALDALHAALDQRSAHSV